MIKLITEKSNFDTIYKAADYYYPRWRSEVLDTNQIRDELARLGHNDDFVDAVIEAIFDRYDDEERYEYEHDYYDESVSRKRFNKRLHEQDVEIEVKHEGILEVPEGKNVDDLPFSHFEKLAKKKGLSKITKALNNLQVWNKNDDPKLSKWAGNMIDKLNDKLGKKESIVRESLDWEIVHEADDDDGNPTMWSAKINSDKYGKFVWVEVSENGFDVVVESGKDNYKTLKSFKTIGRAKKYAEQLAQKSKKESFVREGSWDRYDQGVESRFIDDSDIFLRNDIPNESYFVGASKNKPRTYGTMGDTLYDEIFTFDNDYDEAWNTAMKWNLKGYWVEFERALDGDVVEKNLFKPKEMNKYLNTPLKNESKSLGGRDFGYVDEVLQEYLDFLDEAGIEVINVVPKTKTVYVSGKDFDDAVFYMQDRDYFGKDLYSKGWVVATRA